MNQASDDIQVLMGSPVVVKSNRMRQLFELVRRVAQTTAAVLVTGESGSGKEVIARAIHHYSLRSSKPLVDISCAALPDHLMESELFGYEKGAFSGAVSSKPGLFEIANGGTMYLDEIGELEPKMQVKLLRVLDKVPYYRLGGTHKITVDVRIVAATNRDLEAATHTRAFREDLFHRLTEVHLSVPPLRERVEDIGSLAAFFLSHQNPRLRFSREAIALLERQRWPGNVRQLRNVVTRACVYASGEVICLDALAASGLRNGTEAAPRAPVPEGNFSSDLEAMERQVILSTLKQTDGHYQRAADRLGISRKTLSRKLKTYGIASGGTAVQDQ